MKDFDFFIIFFFKSGPLFLPSWYWEEDGFLRLINSFFWSWFLKWSAWIPSLLGTFLWTIFKGKKKKKPITTSKRKIENWVMNVWGWFIFFPLKWEIQSWGGRGILLLRVFFVVLGMDNLFGKKKDYRNPNNQRFSNSNRSCFLWCEVGSLLFFFFKW